MAKQYSVNMEDGQVVSVVVDGIQYASAEEIPDEQDREKIEELIVKMEVGADEPFDEKEFEREFNELQESSTNFPKKLFVGIFLGIGILMLVIAVLSGINAARTQSREISAPGRVVEMTLRSRYNSETRQREEFYYPKVEFTPAGGSPRTVQLSEGSWPPAYAAGDEVTILYDPQKPNDARIQSASSTLLLWLLPGITFIVGAAFIGATFMVFKLTAPVENKLETVSP